MEKFLKNITPREYQIKIFQSCVKKNCLVILPTGLGKTLIALMLTIERMKQYPGEKVLILAPTRPLAEQHLKSFKQNLPELFGDIQLFTGSIKAGERKKIWETADIIFSTPQCIANDVRKKLYSLSGVCLLVEDEAHRCIKNYDYNYVAQKYKEQAEHQRIVGLTASPGSDLQKIKNICQNLSIEEVELRERESDDVKQYLQKLDFEKIKIDFPPEFEELKQVMLQLLNTYVEDLKRKNVLFVPPTKINLIKLQQQISATIARGNKSFNYLLAASSCAQALKIQHALELVETQTIEGLNKYLNGLFEQAAKKQSKGVVKLVATPEFNFVYSSTQEFLAKNKEHPKINKLIEIIEREMRENPNSKIIIFSQFRDTATTISTRLNKIKGTNSKVFVGQAKKKGTGLSQKEQKQIIEDFSEGKINILCATSIAEEGLDIPEVNAVIFYESVPSAIRAIQRAGRTARLKPGKLIMLLTKNSKDETSYYASRSREKRMKKIISEVKEDLASGKFNPREKQEKLE